MGYLCAVYAACAISGLILEADVFGLFLDIIQYYTFLFRRQDSDTTQEIIGY